MIRHGSLIRGVAGEEYWAVSAQRIMTMDPERPVLEHGAILCRGEHIVAVEPLIQLKANSPCPIEDLGTAILAPALLNSHVHLELAHLRGTTVQGQGFPVWVRSMLAQAMTKSEPAAIEAAVREMRDSGIAHAADVSTRRPDLTAAAMDELLPFFHVLVEFIGYPPLHAASGGNELPWPQQAAGLMDRYGSSVTAAGHALYSTSPDLLRSVKAWCRAHDQVFSLHLAEHEDEEQVLLHDRGEFHAMLSRSLLPADYEPSGLRPAALADSLGLLDERTLAAHCVRVTPEELDLLAERGVSICLCPRSNAYIGVGRAPWESMRERSLNLCLGTDSLASNHDLVLWNEVRFLLENSASRITLGEVLAWMTANPARIFGLQEHLGSLATGRRALMSIVPDDLCGL